MDGYNLLIHEPVDAKGDPPDWLPIDWERTLPDASILPLEPTPAAAVQYIDCESFRLTASRMLSVRLWGDAAPLVATAGLPVVRNAWRFVEALRRNGCRGLPDRPPLETLTTIDAIVAALNNLREALETARTAADVQPAAATADVPNARHSPDFASVNWWGTVYTFTTNQAAVVKVLWEAWQNGTPVMGEPEIQDRAGVESPLRAVFQRHPAWGTLIHAPQRGRYCLAEPEIPAGN